MFSGSVKILTALPKACRSMNILLLNLTRFGDLLQSQAAIHELRRQGHRVAVGCLENFSGAAGLLSDVEHVALLPGATLLAGIDASPGSASGETMRQKGSDWRRSLAALTSWREELGRSFQPDVVCNLTPSLSARLLTRYLSSGGPCSGFTVDEHGFGVNANAWAAFLQGAAAARGVSPFNVVDMFRCVAAGALPAAPGNAGLLLPSETARSEAAARLRAAASAGNKGFVALQLGASENRRRWPVDFFVALGDMLWREASLCPVLLGSKEELALAGRYGAAARHPFVNLCGATSLVQLAAVLCETRMLVTNDTGTMHLAAGLGLPVLAFFFATAQPFDTGPYREGSCCLEPDLACHPCAFGAVCRHDEVCRRQVRPEVAAELVLSRLERGKWRLSAGKGSPWAGARGWLSFFDDRGFMSLRSLSGHDGTERAAWLGVQRHYIRQFLEREPGTGFFPTALHAEGMLCGGGAVAETAERAAMLVQLFLQQGRVVASGAQGAMRERFLGTWHKVHDWLRQSDAFKALALLWVQETQAQGLDLPQVLARAEEFSQLLACIKKEYE